MTDKAVIAPRTAGRLRADPIASQWQLGWRAVAVITALAAIGIGYYFQRYEGSGWHLSYVWCATLFVGTAVLSLTRRLLVATTLVTLLVVIVVQASAVKHKVMNMSVHAYDLVFYLMSPSILGFLWTSYRIELLKLAVALIGLSASLYAAYRMDATRTARTVAVPMMVTFALLTGWSAIMKGERRNTQQYWDDLVVSTFYSSWPETIETLLRGQLIDAADAATGPLFAVPSTCEMPKKRPHVILIHQESVVPPEFFPQVEYDRRADRMFRSYDGALHPLRVETYGGASWLTEFSVLAGVSTYAFGGMRPFVQSLMAGRVHDTLPQALARCGYRNTVFYPLNRNFVSNGKFYEAAGMREILDMKAQGARSAAERDHFYYGNVLNLLSTHVRETEQPLFAYIITMATHAPYLNTYSPEISVPGGAPGTHPEMHEYLRRLSMARIDLEEFKRQLAVRFPDESFLLVQYGDHQPIATRHYLGFGNVNSAEDVTLTKGSPGFLTYYAVEGINYDIPGRLPDGILDVPYLSTVLLEAAGVPLSNAYRERKRLMAACEGRYDSCRERSAILTFHRRLINSGLVYAR